MVRDALAAYAGVLPEQVIATAGADELIDLVVRLFVSSGDKVIDLPPTFGMYRFSTLIGSGEVLAVQRDESYDVDMGTVRRVVDGGVKLLFLANPNNPSGNLTSEIAIRELLGLGIVIVLDETYHEFCGFTAAHLVPEFENLIVIRSMSKWAGLAGLRIGYGIMSPRLVKYFLDIKMPYNLTVATEQAVLASLEDTDHLLLRVRWLVEERERMMGMLQGLPQVECYPSKGNFVLCRLPAGTGEAVHEALQRRGVFVRYFATPRLKDCLRISSGMPEDTDVLVGALREALKEVT
jgi:histidinol-phosphate aminotransferase